ncbi:MAG: acyl-ACP--UDP-N-acetylglucosamine O-acyltransferase [Roseimicrobium sp.]
MPIHPTAIISPEATIHSSAEIGAYVMVEGPVRVGEGCRVLPHAHILGDTVLGEGCTIGRGAIIGEDPQDLSFDRATQSGVRVGKGNVIREYATIHRGSKVGSMTTVGDRNFIMAGVHFAHDVQVGDQCVIANDALLAGHVRVGNRSFIGGGAVFHQFIRIGDGVVVQGNGSFSKDIPHFCMAQRTNRVTGLNVVGLRRQGYSTEARAALKALFEIIFRSGYNLSQAIAIARQQSWPEHAERLLQFLEAPSKKGICQLRANAEED